MSASLDLEQSLSGWEAPIYSGEPHEDVKVWLDLIQAGCEKRSIPEESFPAVSRRFLGEKPKSYIAKCERSFKEISPEFKWNWSAFKIAIVALTHPGTETTEASEATLAATETSKATDVHQESLVGEAWDETNKLISEHPVAARAAGAILLAASAPILVPVASAGALSTIGFGVTGPIASSLVTSLESAVFGGAGGNNSVVSAAQVAMGNRITLAATLKTVSAALTAVLAAIRRWFSWKSKPLQHH